MYQCRLDGCKSNFATKKACRQHEKDKHRIIIDKPCDLNDFASSKSSGIIMIFFFFDFFCQMITHIFSHVILSYSSKTSAWRAVLLQVWRLRWPVRDRIGIESAWVGQAPFCRRILLCNKKLWQNLLESSEFADAHRLTARWRTTIRLCRTQG